MVAGPALSSAAASADGVDEPVGSSGGVSGGGTSGQGPIDFRPEGQVDGSRGPSTSPGPNSRVRQVTVQVGVQVSRGNSTLCRGTDEVLKSKLIQRSTLLAGILLKWYFQMTVGFEPRT